MAVVVSVFLRCTTTDFPFNIFKLSYPICKIREEYKSTHEEVLKSELKFVEKCAELCWTMRISGPTMVIEHTNLEGTKFAKSNRKKFF
jgi:hypothetical protein